MGNTDSIPQEVKDRFATCELETMEKKFVELSKEGSFRGKTFDLTTFKKHYFCKSPELADMVFAALDIDGNRKIDFHEFVQGLSRCTRGSNEEKVSFAFRMFDLDRSRKISRKEFCRGIGSAYFAPEAGESSSERKKRIENSVNTVFAKYDADKDGFLNLKEFSEWCNNAPEMERIRALFNEIDNRLTTDSDSGMSGPIHVTHDTHVGLTQSGEMTIDNIPPSWVMLFKEAGASDNELKNSELVIQLMGIVADRLQNKANLSDPQLTSRPDSPSTRTTVPPSSVEPAPVRNAEPAPPTPKLEPKPPAPPTPIVESAPPTPSVESTPPTPSVESAPPTPSVESTPPTPSVESAPPTPSVESAPPTPSVESTPPTPSVESAPPTPSVESAPPTPSVDSTPPTPNNEVPPPPTETPPSPPPSADTSDLLAGIKKGTKLHHVDSDAREKRPMDTQSSLLAEIKKKPTLRHVDPDEIDKMSKTDRNDLTSVLARAIQSHRHKMNVDNDGNEVNNDDAWE